MAEARRAGEPRWLPIPIALPEPGATRVFELASRRLLLCNAGGTPYVIENSCPHVHVSMEGAVVDGTVLECPHHGGRLDVRDGRPIRMPIRQRAATFAVRAAADGGLEVALPQRMPNPWEKPGVGGG